jgi:hypothetical protein
MPEFIETPKLNAQLANNVETLKDTQFGFSQALGYLQHQIIYFDGTTTTNTGKNRAYPLITLGKVFDSVATPKVLKTKSDSRCAILTDSTQANIRTHEGQIAVNAMFCAVPGDIDKNAVPLDRLVSAIEEFASGCDFVIYSTASATAENPRWRVLIPLAAYVSRDRYKLLCAALNRFLESTGITVDTAYERRTSQPVYLPNLLAGNDFYAWHRSDARMALNPDLVDTSTVQIKTNGKAESHIASPEAIKSTPLYKWLHDAGRIRYDDFTTGNVYIDCPAIDQHGDTQSDNECSVKFYEDGFACQCYHNHNELRTKGLTVHQVLLNEIGEEIAAGTRHTLQNTVPGAVSAADLKEILNIQATPGSGFLPLSEPIADKDTVFPFSHLKWKGPREAQEVAGIKPTLQSMQIIMNTYGFNPYFDSVDGKVKYHALPQELVALQVIDESDILTALVSVAALNGMPDKTVPDLLTAIARNNQVNHVLEYLEQLPHVKGIDALADTVILADEMQKPLFKTVLRHWMIQAIAAADGAKRSPNPAALPKYEYVLAFSSGQGANKTTFFNKLIPKSLSGYFKDGVFLDLKNKDSKLEATSNWIVELGELEATFDKSSMADFKAFTSQRSDTIRVPYGRVAVTKPRRTVFCGSVNDLRFLRDKTGNRRFWPFHINYVDITRLSDEIVANAWAEAWHLYLEGHQWWPDNALQKQLNNLAMDAEDLDEHLMQVFDYYGTDFSDARFASVGETEWLYAREIYEKAGIRFTSERIPRGIGKQLDDVLRRINVYDDGQPRCKTHAKRWVWKMPVLSLPEMSSTLAKALNKG